MGSTPFATLSTSTFMDRVRVVRDLEGSFFAGMENGVRDTGPFCKIREDFFDFAGLQPVTALGTNF